MALQNDKALINNPGYVALSLVFILFGLAVVAASINLLVSLRQVFDVHSTILTNF